MSKFIDLPAKNRSDLGKGASRRLRRLDDHIPAIIYGGEQEPQKLAIDHNIIFHLSENEAFFSSILNVDIDGKQEKAVLKDLQRHPAKERILHVDLLRVSAKDTIYMHIPLHFLNEESAVGVKKGGKISHIMAEIEIKCLAKDLPAFIELDIENLDLDEILHLSDIKLPKGVELTTDISDKTHDHPVVSIHFPRSELVEEETSATEESEESSTGESSAEGEDTEA